MGMVYHQLLCNYIELLVVGAGLRHINRVRLRRFLVRVAAQRPQGIARVAFYLVQELVLGSFSELGQSRVWVFASLPVAF